MTPPTRDDALVDIRDVRNHVVRLVSYGLPPRSIGQAAGVALNTVLGVLDGRQRRCHRGVALSLLGVTTTPRPEQDTVLAIGATRRLHGVAAIGWPLAALARLLQTSPANVSHMTRRPRISYNRWAAVRDVYDRLAGVPGPSELAYGAAAYRRWAPPSAWPTGRIDDPAAVPLPRAAWRVEPIDRRAVAECVAGRRPYYRLGRVERAAAIAQMTLDGQSAEWIAVRLRTDIVSVLDTRDALGMNIPVPVTRPEGT